MRKRTRKFRRALPPIRVSVQRVIVRDGRTLLTCIHPRTGQIWNNVPVLGQGGSDFSSVSWPVLGPTDPSSIALVPESAGCTQGLLHFDRNGAPIYHGSIPRSRKIDMVPLTPDVDEHDPHPGTWSPSDLCMINGNQDASIKMILDALGRWSLISDQIVRIQVPSGKQVKIFSDENSDMPVVLFVPTQSILNSLIERVNANTEILKVMAKYVGVLATAATSTDPTAAADVTAISTWTAGAATSTIAEVGNEIASQTLFVPDDGTE